MILLWQKFLEMVGEKFICLETPLFFFVIQHELLHKNISPAGV